MRFIPLLAALALALPATAQARPHLDDMLAKADLNGDGTITRGEFRENRADQFARFDRSSDGYLSKDDMPRLGRRGAGGRGGERMADLMEAFDRNGDRRLSRAEFVEGPALAFDRADINQDNRIDPGEMRTFREAAAGQR